MIRPAYVMLQESAATMSPAVIVYVLILLSPFGLYALPFPLGIDLTPINFLGVLCFPFFLLACLFGNRLHDISGLGYMHIVYVGIILMGAVFANDQMSAVRSAGGYCIEYLFLFIYVMAFIRTRAEVETAVKMFLAAGVMNATMGLVQLFGFFFFGKMIAPPFAHFFRAVSLKNFGYGTGAFSIPGFMRMIGFLGDAFAPYMLIPLGLSLYCAAKYKGVYRYLALLFTITILLAVARSAYVGCLVIGATMFFLVRTQRERLFPLLFKFYKVCFLFSALVLAMYVSRDAAIFSMDEVSVGVGQSYKTPFFLLKRMNPFIYGGESKSLSYFTEHGDLAVEYGVANFGFGLGAQNFDGYVFERYPVKYGSHSDFILFLGDTGLWGFLLQVMIVLVTVGYGIVAYYRQPRDQLDHLPLMLVGIFLGLMLTGVVRTFYQTPHTYLVAGLIAKLYTFSRPAHKI